MGFKEMRARAKENVRFQATFEGYFIQDGELRLPPESLAKGERLPIGGAQAAVEDGADTKTTTLTRVGAGALIAGPVGALVGGLIKKDKSRAYVTIEFADGRAVVIDVPRKDAGKARAFAAKVNEAGAHYTVHAFGEGA